MLKIQILAGSPFAKMATYGRAVCKQLNKNNDILESSVCRLKLLNATLNTTRELEA